MKNINTTIHSLFFILPVLSFLSLLSITFSSSDDPSSVLGGCSLSDMCGGVNISYPFWRSDVGSQSPSAAHCGYPGFGIACEEDRHPILRTDSGRYDVSHIDYAGRTVNLTDADSSGCPRVRRNVTFAASLSYTFADANLTFFFNCSDDGLPYDFLQNNGIPCLDEYGKSSFVFPSNGVPPEIQGGACEDVVVAPVLLHSLIDSLGDPTYNRIGALNYGFQLAWTAGAPDGCEECEGSGGRRCGFNRTSGSPLCFCPDGTTASNCGGGPVS